MDNKLLTDENLDEFLFEYMPKANILLDQLEEERDKDVDPHIFSNNYKSKLRKNIKEYSRTHAQRKFVALRKYVAGFLILFILTNSLLFATAQEYRERIFEIINIVYEKFTSIVTEVEEVPFDEEMSFTQPSYIPEGFDLVSDMQTDITRKMDYINENKIIEFKQSIIISGETQIDTENTSIEEMKINKHIIKYYFNKGMYNAYWNDNKFSYSISAEVSFEELIKIIEGIQKIK